MALPKIQKKKTVNDLIKDYEASKNSTARIVPKSASSTTHQSSSGMTHGGAGRSLGGGSTGVGSFVSNVMSGAKNVINNVLSKQNANTTPSSSSESISDIIRSNYPTLSGGGGGSSYSGNPAGMVDISNMLKAFDQAAEANKAVVDQSYNERRNDLLTSLKRYQEQNAKDVAAQQKTYLANQALVESAIAEADRQNRISAAARGLGGSGLQQLSQLQTLMSQGQTISDMATENQNVVNSLREVLANYDEDTQTALGNLVTTKENSLKGINSELASNKANLEYQAREAAADRAQMAASTNAQIAAQNAEYEAAAREDERMLNSQLATLQKNYENEISNIKGMSSKALNSLYGTKKADEAKKVVYNNYYANLGEIANAYGIGGTKLAATNYDTLERIYRNNIKPTSTKTLEDVKHAFRYDTDPIYRFKYDLGK